MNRVIKDFAKFDDSTQEDIYAAYSDGELERTSFPFKGEISEGVIYKTDETHYLIPRSSIIAGKAGSSEDLDDDDDDDDVDDDDTIDGDIEADDDLDEE
ncbi:MAG: hypothetical protein NWQ27_04710 [Crocinitomicaceae bacterium]|jgi:hypothetical protein|nr:hypothetical protein [Crocinitomicaceae bacterium]